MKRFAVQSAAASATFLIGAGVVAFCFLKRPLPVAALPQNSPECALETGEEVNLNRSKRRIERIKTLALFREAALDKMTTDADETYRLTWFPAFNAPTVVRIWRSGEKFFIVTKRLSGKGGYQPGKLESVKTRSLTAEEWSGFLNAMNDKCFWNAPSVVKKPAIEDGAFWEFEGMRNDRYHFVDRASPSDQMKEIFRALFDLTGLKTEHDDYL